MAAFCKFYGFTPDYVDSLPGSVYAAFCKYITLYYGKQNATPAPTRGQATSGSPQDMSFKHVNPNPRRALMSQQE